MQRKTIELIVGKPVSAAEAGSPAKRQEVKGSPIPIDSGPDAEVAGRAGYKYLACPSDAAINYVMVDDDNFTWYRCWHCNCLFKV